MSVRNSSVSYGCVSKFFHWTIALLVICMLAFGFFMGNIPDDYKGMVYNIHKLTGLTILTLMIFRVLWMLINPKPESLAGTRWWEKWAERTVHLALYVTVIAMPLAGWIGASAANKPPHIGEFKLLLPVAQSKPLSETSFDMHTILACTIITLLCLHIGAALFHHFVRKDNVLKRMM